MKNNPFIEKQLLIRLLKDDSNILLVADRLKPKHFSEKSYQLIYGSITTLTTEGKPIDMIHIQSEIKEEVDIISLLDVSFEDGMQNVGTIDKMADTLIELWQVREADKVAFDMGKQENPIQYGIEALTNIQTESETDKSETVKDILPRTLELLEARVKAKKNNQVMPDVLETGDFDIDRSGIFRKKQFIVIAARPGMGKSTLAREKAIQMAMHGAHVKYYTLEMGKEEIVFLLMATIAEVNSEKIRDGNLTDQDYSRILTATTKLMALNIEIEMIKPLPELLLDIRKWRVKIGLDKDAAVIVDYLQQIPNRKPNRSRENEVAEISNSFMEISKPLDLCMIGVVQLSRAVETRGGDKRPILSDMRDSGTIEQDANAVIFPFCPAYYDSETDDEGERTQWSDGDGREIGRKLELIIAKNRGGRCYTIWKQFSLRFGKTYNWDSGIIETHLQNTVMIPNKEIPF